MADIALPQPAPPVRWRDGRHITRAGLIIAATLLIALLLAMGWSAVNTEQIRCEFKQGGFSAAFSSGFNIGNCNCKQPKLDFSDPCNSMYIPLFL